jgi:hypothetical protein
VTTDPNFASVSLLLHMDGSGSTFTDSSGTPKTVTAGGNATQSATQSKFGGKSAYFDGNGDYLTLSSSVDLTFGTGDFTVEMWFRSEAHPTEYATLFGGTASGSLLLNLRDSNSNGTPDAVAVNRYGTAGTFNESYAFVQNQWYHIALTRSSGSLRLFVDGTQVGSTATDNTDYFRTNDSVGYAGAAGQPYRGYIDDLRITKGVARYTATFTPPTAALPDA